MVVVSVIIPSLNVARYIEECIDSARNQTLRDIEIICVDAGSTDGTLEIIERKAKDDSRIRIIKSSRRSYGHQMNLGFAAATGKYVAILESDDFIKSGAYAHFVSLAEKTDADLIKADYYIVMGNGKNRSFRRMETCLNRSDYG
ncbi:MAG: glycosyltransferase family 2 protein, partial [Kiritimatiellae bacterium]|nr:glycosyltransferase family 2 protein [Kiritimatiellia bacterium]